MENKKKISALAITLNEAATIAAYIESLWFVDEIVIIDSFSTDDTVKIASTYNKVRVIQRKFQNFSDQKNYALSQAAHDWVLFFDPDEEITPELADEIQNTLKNPLAIAYFVKRDLYFMEKRIYYSGFQSDWIIRVFNKHFCQYNDNLVHEVIESNGTTSKLKSHLPHKTYKSFDDYTAKLHKYSSLQAKMLFEKNLKPTLFHFLFRPFYRFWHQFIIRLGILDGKEGFILAYISAFSVFKRYLNLWLLNKNLD